MACGKIWAQVNVFHGLFSDRSRTGTSEWKETEWSRCQGKGRGAQGEGGGRIVNTGKCTHAKGKKKIQERKKKKNSKQPKKTTPETQIG